MSCKSIQATEALKTILGKDIKCPMCGNNKFVVLEGYFRNDVQPDTSGFVIGGASVPAVAIVCDHCGFISQHAVGVVRPETFTKPEKPNDK